MSPSTVHIVKIVRCQCVSLYTVMEYGRLDVSLRCIITSSLYGGSFRSAQAATQLEFMYHSRIVLSVGGSVGYMIRNLRCTVTIDSVLANSKTQNAFLFTVNAIFLHDYP